MTRLSTDYDWAQKPNGVRSEKVRRDPIRSPANPSKPFCSVPLLSLPRSLEQLTSSDCAFSFNKT